MAAHDPVERVSIFRGMRNLAGTGNAQANTVTGNAGANLIIAAAGYDLVYGGDGNLRGRKGDDVIFGGRATSR